MSLLRRRAKSRSCDLHGDNGCEIQGEAGPRTRESERRAWRAELNDEIRRFDDEREEKEFAYHLWLALRRR